MNFAQMLMMDVKPLPDTRSEVASRNRNRDVKAMQETRRRVSRQKYCEAIGKEWIKTIDIAGRLGMSRMSIYKQLVKYEQLGIIEKRPVGERYNHCYGWEWRVK